MARQNWLIFGGAVVLVLWVLTLQSPFGIPAPDNHPSGPGGAAAAHLNDVNNRVRRTPSMTPTHPWDGTQNVAVLYVDESFDPVNGPLIGSALGNALGLLPLTWRVEYHSQRPLTPELTLRFRDHVTSGRLKYRILTKAPKGKSRQYLMGKAWAFTDPEWWNLIDGENILLLHQTVTLCSGAHRSVDEFVGFDYVGAPWKWATPESPYIMGGNGVLSLRKKSAMLRVLAAHRPMKDGAPALPPTNEDMFFVKTMSEMGGFNVSSRGVGRKFSVEEIMYEAPVGVSYSMRTIPNKDRAVVLSNCPEARVLVGYLPGADWLLPQYKKECEAQGDTPNPPCPYL
eukprot:m.57346 g.57346  ORF g.57346 m.57346 type:complete len:341 (+) comp17079_c0_seq2:273-1295(+)